MQPQASSPSPNGSKSLPAVLPPSGTHIVKMFVVPLLIVGGLLLGSYLIIKLSGGAVLRTPESFLADLRSGDPDVRWRAAQDLARVLKLDDQLASDPAFGLELRDELNKSLDATAEAEQAFAEQQKNDPEASVAAEPKDLEAKRNYTQYLSSCVATLGTPAGVEPLKRMALEGAGGPPARRSALRRWALWSLANLGENLKRFDALSPERQEAVIAGFEERSATDLATYLKERRSGHPSSLGVDEVLVRCMSDSNPFLREVAVFATNFWPGGEAVETALVERLDDKGAGEEQLAALHQGAKEAVVEFRANEGLGIRYQAAVALARRGSARAPLGLLAEMLDESAMMDAHRVRSTKSGQEAPDKAAAYADMENALKAIVELHHKNPALNLASLETPLEKLKDSSNPEIRREAEQTREALAK
jgi:hypothetical protein